MKAAAAVVAVAAGSGIAVACVLIVAILRTDLVEGGPQFGARRSQVLEQVGLMGKLDEKGLIGRAARRRGHHLVEERSAGEALVVEGTADRAAGVDQQTEGQRQIVVLVEIADDL